MTSGNRTLGQKQRAFSKCIAKLILEAERLGYGVTFGEAWRTPEMAAIYAARGDGIKDSVHTIRLAVDFNLFLGTVWLKNTEDHAKLGAYWKTLDPDARWGGDWGDGNHYSFEHNGKK
jgi:hypothetical protein